MRVAIYPDIPQLTDVDDDIFGDGELVDHRPWEQIVSIHAESAKVVQTIDESWEADEGDKIVLEMEPHDFNSLCVFGRVLHPREVAR